MPTSPPPAPSPSLVPPARGPSLTPAPPQIWQAYRPDDGLPYPSITSVAADASGGVWVGTGQAAAHFDGSAWTVYTARSGLISNIVLDVAVDPRGTAWFGTDRGVSRFDASTWTHFTDADGLPTGYVQVVEVDGEGRVWFGIAGAGSDWAFGNGSARLDDGGTPERGDDRWQLFPPTREGTAGDVLSAIVDLGQAGVWFGVTPEGTVRAGDRPGGVWRLIGAETPDPGDDRWTSLPSGAGPLASAVSAFARTPTGELWIGTLGGLVRLPKESVAAFDLDGARFYTTADGLPSNRVLALAAGDDGRVWVGTDTGLAVIDGDRVERMTAIDGLPHSTVRDIAVAPDGSVWVATPDGAGVLR